MKMKGAVLESIVAIAVVVTSSVIIINLISSTVEESKSYTNFNKAKETMTFLDTVASELAVEATGSRRTINVVSDFGTFIVDGQSDMIKFIMESSVTLVDPGTVITEGNIQTIGGPTITAYESDVNNDGVTDLVLENDAVLLAIRKIGSSANITSINTTNLFTQINNKRVNVNITPITYIYLDDNLDAATGNGFTELTEKGTVPSASIRVYVNSSVKEYDAIFTLRGAQDFIELEIKNIK